MANLAKLKLLQATFVTGVLRSYDRGFSLEETAASLGK